MKINSIFSKDLFRPINGVVKVEQQDESIVWQELDEYVITKELSKHFNHFFSNYLEAIDKPGDPVLRSRIGVWVSGFFGSGKSHFIKILSYLLENRLAHNPDSDISRDASDFLDTKIEDKLLLADIKRAVSKDTEVILFNIDSKADSKEDRAILNVFTRVFNESQGYSADAPQIAEIERYLDAKGLFETFQQTFKEVSGDQWLEERDAYVLRRDEIVEALSKTLGKNEKAAGDWFDSTIESFSVTIEKFARKVKEYLDSKGANHRIVFIVDEVGQFIGSNTSLMLNLQTIAEDLGTHCGGKAWVIVTSQEDIDSIIGEFGGAKANDFSKITGRFNTRLSLSSTNTDEVIQARLLEKTAEAELALEKLFADKGDILKNQLSFNNNGATLKNFKDKNDFVINYPFAPYHFQLVQKIFESIRKVGVTGAHLSRGERSMLDAFQSAAKSISEKPLGALVPLYEFYPSIEGFLDTAVKRTIEQADDFEALDEFDKKLLRGLFLIRYVEIIKPTVDNLVTLCIDEIDTDRLALKRRIEDSLLRLEKETLINRNGDLYFFLTNEERDVSREIKGIEINSSEERKFLSELVYEEVLEGSNKFRYSQNKNDYDFNRFCDGAPFGKISGELSLEIISPLNDEFSYYNGAKCIGASNENGGKVLIKLSDNPELGREIRAYKQTQKYVDQKSDAAAPDSLQRILKDRAEENSQRKIRLTGTLNKMLREANIYVLGQSLTLQAATAKAVVSEAQNYFVKNIYIKLDYLSALNPDPLKEIRALLTIDDVGRQSILVRLEEANAKALSEVRQYIDLRIASNQRISLDELVAHFAKVPYGWNEWEIILLVARLFVASEINLILEGAILQPREAVEPLSKSVKWKQITVLKRKVVGESELKVINNLAQKIFHTIGPDTEDALGTFIREKLGNWKTELLAFQNQQVVGNYPGKQEIVEGLKLVNHLLKARDTYEFFGAFTQRKDDLLDLSEDVHQLDDFYKNQRATWDKLRSALSGFFLANRRMLESDMDAKQALSRMEQILLAANPYGMLKETDSLIAKVNAVNERLIAERREQASRLVDEKIEQAKKALDEVKADADSRNEALRPLQEIKKHIQSEQSIPAISHQQLKVEDTLDQSLELIERQKPSTPESKQAQSKPVKQVRASTLAPKLYLDTQEDIDEFLNSLRTELEAALQNNHRIRIQ